MDQGIENGFEESQERAYLTLIAYYSNDKKICNTFVNITKTMISKIATAFFFLLFVASFYAPAQEPGLKKENDSLRTASGKIEIIQDARIDSLVKIHKEVNESRQTIEGFRLQISIASGANSRKTSNDAKAAFLSKYPDTNAYVIHQAPNFKVRAGDFRTKLEATRFLNEIKKDFPGAFIVKDEINLPEL